MEKGEKRFFGVEIKEATEKDFGEIIRLVKEEFPYFNLDETKIKERIEKKKIFLFKAVEGSGMLGFIELQLLEESIARINGLTVKPEHRNKGVAKKLLDFALLFLREKKIERILLLVKQGNEVAKRLYEEAGFKFVGLYSRNLDGSVVEEMELDFEPSDSENLNYVG